MPFDDQTQNAPRVVLGKRHKRLLSEAIQLQEEVVPQFVKPALFAITLLVAGFITWSAFVEINEVATAPGEVVPSGSVKVVEHLEGGTVAEILVKEGQRVEAGEAMFRLDGTQDMSELNQMEARYVALRLRGERLSAFAEDRDPDFSGIGDMHPDLVADQQKIYVNQVESLITSRSVIQSQIEQRKRELRQMQESLTVARQQQKVTGEMVVMRQKMVEKKLIPRMEFLETRRAKITADGEVARILDQIKVIKQTVTESQRRLEDLGNQTRREALGEMGTVSAEIAEVRNTIARLKDRVDNLEIAAPSTGLVQDLRILTIGQVVQPGALITQIVPVDQKLEAEVRISTDDIGHVKIGQAVMIKVGSYDFSRFGGITGSLRGISATSYVRDKTSQYAAAVKENSDAFFKGWVIFDRDYVGDDPGKFKVATGMSVQADITTGNKTLLQYLLKPLTDALNRAFHER